MAEGDKVVENKTLCVCLQFVKQKFHFKSKKKSFPKKKNEKKKNT